MTKTNLVCAGLPVLLSLCWSLAIQAAPVSTTDADEVPDQPAPAVISAPSPTTGAIDKSSPSHAVDLLIELQSKSAGLDFNERARENGNAPRPVITPGAAPQQPMPAATTQNAAGLFGSGAVPMPVARENTAREADWRSPARSVAAGPVQQDSGHSGGGEGAGGGLLKLPREIIQWVRENRSLVVGGAILVLALLWLSSMAVARRKG